MCLKYKQERKQGNAGEIFKQPWRGKAIVRQTSPSHTEKPSGHQSKKETPILGQLMISQANGNGSIIAASKQSTRNPSSAGSKRRDLFKGAEKPTQGAAMARELFFLQFVRASPRGTNGILSCVLAVIVLNFIQKPQAQFSVCSVLEVVLVYRLTIPFRQSPLKSLSRMQKNKYLVASLLFFFFKKRTLFFFHHQRASWSSQPVSFEINVLTFQSC